jgi:nitrous oxidase accessory protein NosD
MAKSGLGVAFASALTALFVTVSPAGAQQTDCRVKNLSAHKLQYKSNSDANPLASAIEEAQPGDTLQVSGVCSGNFAISKNLTLTGRYSGRHEDVIDGGGSGIVLRNTSAAGAFDLTLSDLTITGGEIGVLVDAASLSLARTRVTGNSDIGVLNGAVASTTIEDSVISDNGGLGVQGSLFGSIAISNSTVRDNAGGGIYSGRAALTIANSLIADNTIRGGVGGNRHIEVADSVIEGNTSVGFGGGIAAFDLGTLDLTRSIVRGNSAIRGGGIFLDHSLGVNTFTDSVVSGNTATEAGGGVFALTSVVLNGTNSLCGNVPDDWPGCTS